MKFEHSNPPKSNSKGSFTLTLLDKQTLGIPIIQTWVTLT